MFSPAIKLHKGPLGHLNSCATNLTSNLRRRVHRSESLISPKAARPLDINRRHSPLIALRFMLGQLSGQSRGRSQAGPLSNTKDTLGHLLCNTNPAEVAYSICPLPVERVFGRRALALESPESCGQRLRPTEDNHFGQVRGSASCTETGKLKIIALRMPRAAQSASSRGL